MALIQSSDLSIGYVYAPLVVSAGIEVTGNVSAAQQYDIAENLYTPNYAATFLTLRPWFSVSDPDGIVTDGEQTPGTDVNMSWEVIEDGVSSAVTAGTDYGIGSDGTLTVKRNAEPDKPLTFRVTMEYEDPRTGAVYERVESILVTCQSISASPVLSLDAPAAIMYDPVFGIGYPMRTVKARLTVGSQEVASSKRRFVWQKKDAILGWHQIHHDETQNDLLDYDVHLNADESELTINCEYMGDRLDIRCYALYAPYGNASSMTVGTDTPMEEFAVVRHIPKLNGVVLGANRISPTLKAVRPELKLFSGDREIANPETVCDIVWKQSTGVSSGAVTYGSAVAQGTTKPTLPTTNIAQKFGGKIAPFFGVKLPLAALKTSDGKYLTTSDGKVLIGRPSQT